MILTYSLFKVQILELSILAHTFNSRTGRLGQKELGFKVSLDIIVECISFLL